MHTCKQKYNMHILYTVHKYKYIIKCSTVSEHDQNFDLDFDFDGRYFFFMRTVHTCVVRATADAPRPYVDHMPPKSCV